MILTVTLNPLLERRIAFNTIKNGAVNRNGKIEVKSGGKGINVSRQLNNLGIDNLALSFSGGTSGREFKDVDWKSTRLNSSHLGNSYAAFCLKKITSRSIQAALRGATARLVSSSSRSS